MVSCGPKDKHRRNGLQSIEWCAGFFEGEGNFGLNNAKGGKVYLKIQVAQVDPRPLEALVECFGGRVLGPYGPYRTNKQPYYQWGLYGEPAKEVALKMLPFLFQKADQIEKVLANYDN